MLGVEAFGQFSLALALIGFGAVVGAGGQGRLALADAPERGRLRGVRSRRRVVTACALGASAVSGGWFGWSSTAQAVDAAVGVGAVAFAAFVGSLVVFEADTARSEGRNVSAEVTTGRNGGPLALSLMCVVFGLSLLNVLPAISLTSALVIVGGCTCASLAVTGSRSLTAAGGGDGWSVYARRGRWLWASQFVAQSMQVVDLLIAAVVLPNEQLAVYAGARLVAMQGSFFLQVSSLAHARAVATTFASDDRLALAGLLRRAALLATLPAAGLVAVSAAAGRWLLPIAFGDAAFASGATALTLLAVASMANASSGLAGYLLSVADEARALTACNIGSVVGVAVLGLVLGSIFGAGGLGAAVLITSVGYNVAVVLTARRRLGVRPDVFSRSG